MILCWVYRSRLCFWQLIPLGIWYNCLYQLGYALLRFPICYSCIIFGIVFMLFCCPWCSRVLGWVTWLYLPFGYSPGSVSLSLLVSQLGQSLLVVDLESTAVVLSYGILNCSVPMCSNSSSLPFFLVPPNTGWFPQFCIECIQNFLVLFWLVSGYIGVIFYTFIKVLTYHYWTGTRYILYQCGVLNDSCDSLW